MHRHAQRISSKETNKPIQTNVHIYSCKAIAETCAEKIAHKHKQLRTHRVTQATQNWSKLQVQKDTQTNCTCYQTHKGMHTQRPRTDTTGTHTHTNTLNKTLRHRRNRFPFPCDMNAKACRNMEEEQLDQQSRLARLQLLEGCRLAPTTMLGLGCRYVGCKLAT